jgi:uncharacterized protein
VIRVRFTLSCVALIALGAAAFAALTFPVLSGRVVDEAGLLDVPARVALIQSLAALEAKTTDQLVVVTLKSLQGTSIEDYGYQLGRHWQIGQKDKNNGVILIVAPNERKVRIEVGYGLEGTLTDAIGSFIIQNSILPRFKAGDFPGGIKRGVEDIIQVLSGDAEEYKARAAASTAPQKVTAGEAIVMLIFMLIAFYIVISVIVGVVSAFSAFVPGKKGKRSRSWIDAIPVVIGSGGSSSGSSSSGGFSGGGGSFGGGGSSGSW